MPKSKELQFLLLIDPCSFFIVDNLSKDDNFAFPHMAFLLQVVSSKGVANLDFNDDFKSSSSRETIPSQEIQDIFQYCLSTCLQLNLCSTTGHLIWILKLPITVYIQETVPTAFEQNFIHSEMLLRISLCCRSRDFYNSSKTPFDI